MKNTTGGSFCSSIVLLLLCFLHEGVGEFDTGPDVTSQGRSHDSHGHAAMKNFRVTHGTGDYLDRQEYDTRYYGDERTSTGTRTEERIDQYPYHDRMSGKGITDVDNSNERTAQHHYYGDGTAERTYSNNEERLDYNPYHERMSGAGVDHVDNSNERISQHHYYGDGITTDEIGDSDESGGVTEESDETDGDSTEESNATGHYDESGDSDEESGDGSGDESDKSGSEKEEVHPIGLINALGGKATIGRSVDLDSRELDTTSSIIFGVVGGACAVCMIFLFCCLPASSDRKTLDDESKSRGLLTIFQYLTGFNAEDIDIQLSAAGGFHVGYLNGLAKGINAKEQANQKIEDSTSSSDDGSRNGSSAGLSQKI